MGTDQQLPHAFVYFFHCCLSNTIHTKYKFTCSVCVCVCARVLGPNISKTVETRFQCITNRKWHTVYHMDT